jgi:hypothetical protein
LGFGFCDDTDGFGVPQKGRYAYNGVRGVIWLFLKKIGKTTNKA